MSSSRFTFCSKVPPKQTILLIELPKVASAVPNFGEIVTE